MTGPELLILGASAAFGAVIGSFLNVVIHRLPQEGRSVMHPRRSVCPSCDAEIAWFDNIPVISWVVLRGKCRACSGGISLRYPLVEILTAGLFVLVAYRLVVMPARIGDVEAWLHLAAAAALTCALVVSTFIDFDHQIIPDRITKRGMILAPAISLLAPDLHQTHWIPEVSTRASALILSLLGIAMGVGVVYGMRVIGGVMFRKKAAKYGGAMGLGDVKFMGLIGGMVGPLDVVVAFFLAAVIGACVGIPRRLIWKDQVLAFGPYLSLGSFIVLVFRNEIMRGYEGLLRAYESWLLGVLA